VLVADGFSRVSGEAVVAEVDDGRVQEVGAVDAAVLLATSLVGDQQRLA